MTITTSIKHYHALSTLICLTIAITVSQAIAFWDLSIPKPALHPPRRMISFALHAASRAFNASNARCFSLSLAPSSNGVIASRSWASSYKWIGVFVLVHGRSHRCDSATATACCA